MMPLFLKCSQQYMSKRSGNALTILTYHRVAPEGQITYLPTLTTEAFARQLGWIKRYYQVLTLAAAGRLAAEGRLPKHAAVITVDDGYDDCFHYIFPLLQQHGLSATFFITTAGLTDGQLWEEQIAEAIIDAPTKSHQLTLNGTDFTVDTFNKRLRLAETIIDQLKYLTIAQREEQMALLRQATGISQRSRQFLQPEQIRQMAKAGMEFGAHSVHHPILMFEQDNVAEQEIRSSKLQLEQLLQQEVVSFAYPNGQYGRDFGEHHIEMVKNAGFHYAVSTVPGSNTDIASQALCLHRVSTWPTSQGRFILSLLLRTQRNAGGNNGY